MLCSFGYVDHMFVCFPSPFQTRTRSPNGLLIHESVYLNSSEPQAVSRAILYNVFLTLEHSRFKVVFQHEHGQDELYVGNGFNRDRLHQVSFYINPQLGFLNVRINDTHLKYYKSLYLNTSAILANNVTSLDHYRYQLTIGSATNIDSSNLKLNYTNFIGCLGNFNIISRSDQNNFGTLSQSSLKLNNVQPGCVDRCQDQYNLCSRRSKCINYYNGAGCDCFGTELEDWHCRSFNYTVVTLRGYSTIGFKIYDYFDKYYSDENLISLHLKTRHDGLLFMGLAEVLKNYLIVSIKNGFLNVMFNLGHSPKNYIFNDFRLTDDRWHNVTISQERWRMAVFIDTDNSYNITLDDSSSNTYFFFDPGKCACS